MPFIGRDWRSPGEAWVKTQEGWQRQKILEVERLTRKMEKRLASLYSDEGNSDSDGDYPMNNICESQDLEHWQPYCHITLKSTKEVAGYNTISEAFRRLDFPNAVRDMKRFNYISKLLHLLITQNLTSLSGCATKVLFTMLEEVAWQVASNQQNIHILHLLLHDLKKTMRKYYCWGRPLGSTILWEQHLQTIERICCMASAIEIKKPMEDGGPRITDLPTEMIREILLRLSDYKDLINSGQAYDIMQGLLDEQHIWRQLCHFHYSRQQVNKAIEEEKIDMKTDWQKMFHQLRRKYGLKEDYTDCLFLCRHCRCLFWKSFGHPCLDRVDPIIEIGDYEEEMTDDVINVPLYIPIPPHAFLEFFSL